MKKSRPILGITSVALFSIFIDAQEKPKEKEWNSKVYGWVRTEYSYDTRQSAYSREYLLNLYPNDVLLDKNGKDVNATRAAQFLSITSRVGVNFRGPNVWGAKANGKIEADFFGNTELNKTTSGTGSTGLLRLRHAYAALDWGKSALTFGQTWYPSFITDVFPGVVNFNTGIMFNPFGWATQVKLIQKLSPELALSVVAYKDREFQTATGGVTYPAGVATAVGSANSATFNSATPTFHGQLQYKNKHITAGIAAEYQSLKPIISTGSGTTLLADNEKVNSADFLAYFKYSNDKFTAKAYGITGGNLNHMVMLGGFAGYKESNGQESYKPTKTSAFWVDLSSNNDKVTPGVFFGYTKNEGCDTGFQSLYTRGANAAYTSGSGGSIPARVLNNVWRASARVEFKQNKFSFAPEVEYTAAKWGDLQNDGTSIRSTDSQVGNLRTTVRVEYSF